MNADSVLDALDAFVYAKDRDGAYTYANKAVRDLFGADLDDIVGKDDSAFFDLEQSDELRRNDLEVMATGLTVRREERDVVKETGAERIFHTVKAPLRDAAGEVVGLVGISLDITPDA